MTKNPTSPLIDAYLDQLDAALRDLPPARRDMIRRELLAHLADAAAEQQLRLDDPDAQAQLLTQLGPSEQLARSFRRVHGHHYAWFGLAGMLGALVMPVSWLCLAYVRFWLYDSTSTLTIQRWAMLVPLSATLLLLLVFQLGLYGRYGSALRPWGRLGLQTSMLGGVLMVAVVISGTHLALPGAVGSWLLVQGLASFGLDATGQRLMPGWRFAPLCFGLSPLLMVPLFVGHIELLPLQIVLLLAFPLSWFSCAYLLWKDRSPALPAPGLFAG